MSARVFDEIFQLEYIVYHSTGTLFIGVRVM